MRRFDITQHLANMSQVFDLIVWNTFRKIQVEPMIDYLCMRPPANLVHVQEDENGRYIMFRGRRYLAQLARWDGERRDRGKADAAEWKCFEYDYEVSETVRRQKVRQILQGALGSEQRDEFFGEIVDQFMTAWKIDPVDFVHGHLRRNDLKAYDDEPLFSELHRHIDGRKFSNVLQLGQDELPARSNPNKPDFDEFYNEVLAASRRLINIRLQRNKVQLLPDDENLKFLIIVRSENLYEAASELRETELHKVGTGTDRVTQRNRFFQRLTIAKDISVPNEEDFSRSFDLIALDTKNREEPPSRPEEIRQEPKPLVYVETVKPEGVDFDTSNMFTSKKLRLGLDGSIVIGAGFPEMMVRTYNTQLAYTI